MGEKKPYIWTSRSHCLHVYSHSVEQTLFICLTTTKHTHTHSSAAFKFSASDSQFLDKVFTGCTFFFFFLNEKPVSLYAFYSMDSQTLLTTMFSILMFRILLVQWLFVFCFHFFVLIMLIRGVETKGRQMLYCCRHAIIISYHPPSGQCSGNEVQRVSQVILHSGGVYVCVYMCIYP